MARTNNDAPEPNNTPNLWAQQYFVSVINDCQSTVACAVDVNYSLGILLADKNEGTRWGIFLSRVKYECRIPYFIGNTSIVLPNTNVNINEIVYRSFGRQLDSVHVIFCKRYFVNILYT